RGHRARRGGVPGRVVHHAGSDDACCRARTARGVRPSRRHVDADEVFCGRFLALFHRPKERKNVGETLHQWSTPVAAPDGSFYEARACGSLVTGGTWHGWIEFVPLDGGGAVRSQRETTQPNRTDTAYWATGLTEV